MNPEELLQEPKIIDLNKTLYNLTEEYPELINIFTEIGFSGAANPVMRKTVGKKVTILEGIRRQRLEWNKVIKILKDNGFKVIPEEAGIDG